MKKVIFALMCLPGLTMANALNSHQAILESVEQGKPITVITDFNQCQPSYPAKGVYSPQALMIKEDGTIAFSHKHFTRRASVDKPFVDHIRYQLSPSGQLTLTSTWLSPITFEPINNEVKSYQCELGNGAQFFSR